MSDYVNELHEIGEENDSINYKKVVFLLIVMTVCSVFMYRLYTIPSLNMIQVSTVAEVYQEELTSTKLRVTETTTWKNSTLNLWKWTVLAQTEYDVTDSKVLSVEAMTWDEWVKKNAK